MTDKAEPQGGIFNVPRGGFGVEGNGDGVAPQLNPKPPARRYAEHPPSFLLHSMVFNSKIANERSFLMIFVSRAAKMKVLQTG